MRGWVAPIAEMTIVIASVEISPLVAYAEGFCLDRIAFLLHDALSWEDIL